jgi:ubiquinone biosynthesis monooxygenase Coq7
MSSTLEVERILRVDHAGERGAVSIYKAQIMVARYLWPSHVPALQEMLSHELAHFALFKAELERRNIRACYALGLWNIGGAVLGFITALLGPKAIWSCTAAIEQTVYKHLLEQMAFLERHDSAALLAVQSIEQDEKSHLAHALDQGGGPIGTNRLIWALVSSSTFIAIWLSQRL